MDTQALSKEEEAKARRMLAAGFGADLAAREINRSRTPTSNSPANFKAALDAIQAKLKLGASPHIPRKKRMGPLEGVEDRHTPNPPAQVVEFFSVRIPRVQKWMDGQEPAWPGFIFYGKLGRGKSGTAVQIARYVNAAMGWHCRYEKLWRMLARMKDVNVREVGERGEIEVVDEYCKAELLIVDDAGVNPGTASDHRIIYEVLDTRYERLLPTIITTNFDLDDENEKQMFLNFFGTRTADRFQGCKDKFEGVNLRAA